VSLATGTKLGPYEIVAPLAAGGMGEVYRATDTNLKRQAAIKVLPPAVAADMLLDYCPGHQRPFGAEAVEHRDDAAVHVRHVGERTARQRPLKSQDLERLRHVRVH
jgi:serine/threonine protein kinase